MKNNQAKDSESLSQSHHEISKSEQVSIQAKDLKIQCKEFSGKNSGQNTQTVNNRNERQRVNQVNTESQEGKDQQSHFIPWK